MGETLDSKIGKWTVGNCIAAEFDMKFVLPIVRNGVSSSIDVYIPPTAEVVQDDGMKNGKCDLMKGYQSLELKWVSNQEVDGLNIEGNISIEFAGFNNLFPQLYHLLSGGIWKEYSTYGIHRVFGSFEIIEINNADKSDFEAVVNNNETISSRTKNSIAIE